MSTDLTVLRDICRNAEMGEATITRLLPHAHSTAFRRVLKEQLRDYRHILGRAKRLAERRHAQVKGLHPAARHCAAAMIRVKTAMDSSSSHLAAMMIQGSNMGIIDITRQLNRTPQLHSAVRMLATDLLTLEQQNLEDLKRYL